MMMMMTMEGMMDKVVLDDIIRRLLEGRGGKQVQLSESEIRQLCVNARQIFLSQPNLVEVEAPIRICGELFLNKYFGILTFVLILNHAIVLFLFVALCINGPVLGENMMRSLIDGNL